VEPLYVFVMLQYFEKISPLVESLACTLQDEVHVMGCRATGGACDVIQNSRHFGCHLGFYRKLKLSKNAKNRNFFYAGHVEYGIIKHFAAFC